MFLQEHVTQAEFVIPTELHNGRGYHKHSCRKPQRVILSNDKADRNYHECQLPDDSNSDIEGIKCEVRILMEIWVLAGEFFINRIPEAPGHHRDWIDACKGGQPANPNFDYAGPMTEVILLGNVALRMAE